MARMATRLTTHLRLLAMGAISIAAAGCQIIDQYTTNATTVTVGQFNDAQPRPDIGPVVEVPPEMVGPPSVMRSSASIREQSGTTITASRETMKTDVPGAGAVTMPVGPDKISASVEVGRAWPVEALVGQINGKAIYADDFLGPLEDRLVQLGANRDRARARREIVSLIDARFDEEVNNRLVISEAESTISPEMREGLFEFLRSMQEKEIAGRGGNRAAAQTSLQEEFGMSIEQFMERRKNEVLAQDLLRKRIEPRTIVSWRDIERAYEQGKAEFNPPATVTLGRISVRSSDAAKVEEVGKQLESGVPFAEVARGLGIPKDGVWIVKKLDDKGIEGITDLTDAVKDKLRGLQPGQASAPFQQGINTVWVAVLALEKPEPKSLFDWEVQLRLRNELIRNRRIIEQNRYFIALRSRWISDDINEMKLRLIAIALDRYYR